jgi:hypothetical protein
MPGRACLCSLLPGPWVRACDVRRPPYPVPGVPGRGGYRWLLAQGRVHRPVPSPTLSSQPAVEWRAAWAGVAVTGWGQQLPGGRGGT